MIRFLDHCAEMDTGIESDFFVCVKACGIIWVFDENMLGFLRRKGPVEFRKEELAE